MKLKFERMVYRVFTRDEILSLGVSPIPKNALFVLALIENVGNPDKADFLIKNIECWSQNKSVLDKLAKNKNQGLEIKN